jgi:hypothetical protein
MHTDAILLEEMTTGTDLIVVFLLIGHLWGIDFFGLGIFGL